MQEIVTTGLFEAYLNSHSKKGSKPVQLPHPWDKKTVAEEVTPEERQRLREQLARRSAFRDT